MTTARVIDQSLLNSVIQDAQNSPRRRKNFNFHTVNEAPAHRLLNALEPDSYIPPHRHLDSRKDETMIALSGRLACVFFDDAGQITQTCIASPGRACLGVDIPHGVWHSVFALDSGTVFLEAKAGPYEALTDAEKAPWAPAEQDEGAADYLATLRSAVCQ